jgi:hypothetical protein
MVRINYREMHPSQQNRTSLMSQESLVEGLFDQLPFEGPFLLANLLRVPLSMQLRLLALAQARTCFVQVPQVQHQALVGQLQMSHEPALRPHK